MAETGVFFKRPLPSLDSIGVEVSKQLELRKKLYAKDTTAVNSSDINFIQSFINGNNCFVKLTSGVEVESDKELAFKNILQSGTLTPDKKLRKGLSYESFADDSTAAYNFEQKEGFVPMPGIVDVKIKNRGNSGFTREADITVRCFSLEQLSALEKLYLRPGFKCLLEWGHAVYATKDVEDTTGVITSYSPKTIDLPSTGKIDIETIKEKGAAIIKQTQHNYDYMIGLIKNYNWSYENDGFTLNIELLGEGAVTTFLKQMYTGTSHEEKKATSEEAGVEFNATNQTTFADILKTINDSDKRGDQKSSEIVEEADTDRIKAALDKRFKDSIAGIEALLNTEDDSFELKIYRASFNSVSNQPGRNRFNYISMRYLLGMINYFFLPKPNASDKVPDGKFNTTPEVDFFITYPEHFSIDPSVCLLANQTGKYGLKTQGIIDGKREKDRGDIMDIYLSTDFLYNEYVKIRQNEKGENNSIDLSVGKYLNNVLAKVRASLGSINEFVLYNDYYLKKGLGPSKVIDLQLVPRPEGQPDKYTILVPKGKESYIQSFSFNSELSNSMINLIVNQAILTGVDAGKATSDGLATFNSGLSNRFNITQNDEARQLAKKRADAAAEAKQKLEDQFKSIFDKKKFEADVIDKAYGNGADLIQQELNDFLGTVKPKRGHIGAKVNITMVGIGGLKSLQFFKLPDAILPASYYENNLKVGFQISNVSHDLSSQKWTTTIEANAVILSQG